MSLSTNRNEVIPHGVMTTWLLLQTFPEPSISITLIKKVILSVLKISSEGKITREEQTGLLDFWTHDMWKKALTPEDQKIFNQV